MEVRKILTAGYRFPNRCFVRFNGNLTRMSKVEAYRRLALGQNVEFVSRSAARAAKA